MAPIKMTEAQLQKAVAAFLDRALPEDALWFHVPNSIRTTSKQAAIHKAFGMKAGVADCIIVWAGRVYAIELKVKGGAMRDTQKAWRDRLIKAGGRHATAKSLEAVAGALALWNIPVRAAVMAGGGWRAAA